jgi:general secretion pathway protein J
MKTLCTQAGFTLVEILLAITIFAVAMTTLFTTFNTVISGVEPMKTGMDDVKTARIAMERIEKDLMSLCLTLDPAYLPPDIGQDIPPDIFRFVSETGFLDGSRFSDLRFASFEHLSFRPEDTSRIGVIHYYVAALDNDSLVLKRADTGAIFYDDDRRDVNPSKDPVVCDRILAFELAFIDQEGEPKETWNSDASDFGYGTPLAVEIRLSVGDEHRARDFETTVFLPVVREKADD